MNNKLTKKQALIIEFINVYTGDHGRSPSYREIMTALGLNSVSAVAEHIDNLVAKGALKRTPGAARSLEVVDTTYPETTDLFRRAMGLVKPEEKQVLFKAAQILGLELIPEPTAEEKPLGQVISGQPDILEDTAQDISEDSPQDTSQEE